MTRRSLRSNHRPASAAFLLLASCATASTKPGAVGTPEPARPSPAAAAPARCQPTTETPSDQAAANEAVIRRFFAQVLEGENPNDVLSEVVAPDAMNHASGRRGLDGFRFIVEALRREAPDQHYEILRLVAAGDLVVVHTERTGTSQLDSFRRYPIAAGQAFRTTHAHFFRLQAGRIVEHWAVRDDLGMAQQLGAIPSPPAR